MNTIHYGDKPILQNTIQGYLIWGGSYCGLLQISHMQGKKTIWKEKNYTLKL